MPRFPVRRRERRALNIFREVGPICSHTSKKKKKFFIYIYNFPETDNEALGKDRHQLSSCQGFQLMGDERSRIRMTEVDEKCRSSGRGGGKLCEEAWVWRRRKQKHALESPRTRTVLIRHPASFTTGQRHNPASYPFPANPVLGKMSCGKIEANGSLFWSVAIWREVEILNTSLDWNGKNV